MANGAYFASATGAYRAAGNEVDRALEAQAKQPPVVQPMGLQRSPSNRAALTHAAIEAQRALREAATAAATATLRARSMAAVLDETLAALADAGTTSAGSAASSLAASTASVALSPRERDVLALVAEGRTNKAIAEALFVSPNTVKTHVASLLRKHDVGTRAQLAALVGAQAVR